MDDLRPALLRTLVGAAALALTAAGLSTPTFAQRSSSEARQDPGYRGPYLSWVGKTAAPAPQPAPTPQPGPAPQPAPAAEPPPAPQPIALAPPPPQVHDPVSYTADGRQSAQGPVAEALPPVAAPLAPAAVASASPPARAPAPAQPHPPAAAPAPVPQAMAQNAAPATTGETPVRFYSLHRDFGITPDPVATPTDRPMVLIGPPDNPTASQTGTGVAGDDDQSGHGQSDQNPDGDGHGQDGAQRRSSGN